MFGLRRVGLTRRWVTQHLLRSLPSLDSETGPTELAQESLASIHWYPVVLVNLTETTEEKQIDKVNSTHQLRL